MRKRIRKFKRDWLRDRIIANGEKLRSYQRARAGVDADAWPDDCEYLDGIITNLERKGERLLRKFKES